MNCTNCGSPLTGRPGYCGTCGQPLSFPTDATAVLPVVPPHAEPYAPPTSIPVADSSPYAPPGYGKPFPGYDAYGQLAPDYGKPAPGYGPANGEPPASYDQPRSGYGQPEYNQQTPAYGPPMTAYPVSPPPASYPLEVPPAGQLYGPPPVQPYPAAGQPYGPGQYYGEPIDPPRSVGNALSIIAIALAAIAVFILPVAFGIAGIICAAIARKRGEGLGSLSLKLAITGTALGMIVGVALAMVN